MILHVLGSMTAGGNERLCLELIRRTPPGQRSSLLTIDPAPDGGLTDLFRSIPGLDFYTEPYSRHHRARFVARLALQLHRLKPTGVVVYPFGLHLLVATALKVVPSCRIIAHVGNPPAAEGRDRTMFRRIVTASRWLKTPLWFCSDTVHAQFLGLEERLPRFSRAVPNGIDVAALRSAAATGRETRARGSGPVITMVARLDAIKDHDTLLAAFRQVREREPSAKLWLIGDGDRRMALQQKALDLNIGASISFLGVRQDVGVLLGQTDIFVFSTTPAEGFGIALAEAMAVGLPIVASDVTACREVLGQGECGRLVPPRHHEALADAVLDLLRNSDRRQQLGALAHQRALREYDIGACARRYYGYLMGTSLN